jgi:ATP-dependent exoDNAse (exonuclease V) alpha subunit
MMLTNGNGYFNGSTGIIDYVHEDEYDDEESYVCIRINGERCYVYKNTYKVFKPVVDERKKTVVGKDGQSKEIIEKTVKNEEAGEVIQYPFKLGYAVTIHKSQGMTLTNGVNLKPEIWDSGQLYVALSRVDKRENIYIDGILKPNNWKLDRKVIDFYKQIDSKWAN